MAWGRCSTAHSAQDGPGPTLDKELSSPSVHSGRLRSPALSWAATDTALGAGWMALDPCSCHLQDTRRGAVQAHLHSVLSLSAHRGPQPRPTV